MDDSFIYSMQSNSNNNSSYISTPDPTFESKDSSPTASIFAGHKSHELSRDPVDTEGKLRVSWIVDSSVDRQLKNGVGRKMCSNLIE